MIPPVAEEEYFIVLAAYLNRIAAQKREQNILDHMFAYSGHGYHSESLNAWENESLALREQFPELFTPGSSLVNYNHTFSDNMKGVLLREIQQPALDVAIFHAHGGDDAQYLNGFPPAESIKQNVDAIKRFVRGKMRAAKHWKRTPESVLERYASEYAIPREWFDDALNDSLSQADSLLNAGLDIYMDDVKNIVPQAELIIFDQCFTGQFT